MSQDISEIYGMKLPGYAWHFHIQSSNQIACPMYLFVLGLVCS